ncbi:MAG: HDIG domain-containing protein [Longimicrobiales bacterium]
MSRAPERPGGVAPMEEPPAPRSPWERSVYHGVRAAVLLAVAVTITVLFPPRLQLGVARYDPGMVAPEDIIAEIPFSVPKTPEELTRERRLAMESVSPTYDRVPTAVDSMAAQLQRFFDAIDQAAEASNRARVRAILDEASLVATPSQVDRLMAEDSRESLRRVALMATRELLPQGVVDASQALDLTTASVTVREGEVERSIPAEQVVTSREFLNAAQGLLPPDTPPDVTDLLRIILIRHIEYTYVLNLVATELDRDAAARSVPTTKEDILQGQAIVRAADPIGAADVERLNAYEDQLRARGMLERQGLEVGAVLGAVLLNTLLLAIFGLLVLFFRPEVYANLRWLSLVALLTLAYFAAAMVIARNGLASEWLPIAFVALPVGVLWDARMSLVLVMALAAITGTLPPFADYGTVLAVMAGGAAAAMSVRAVRRRSETWVSIAIIATATGLVLLGYGLESGQDLSDVGLGSVRAAGNATVSALLAMGFLWVFELFTGITTDQTLLEWADPTRPLLKRLSLEAPGTYAHTINVANLSEAACNAIGANGLLCRVGVYYHDVGKMLKPHYFVENQPDGRNPHDKLKPETSAAIVKEHVTEGVRLARDAGVPEVVAQFILEHHGTQKIGFFYEKAREEHGTDVDVARFSYPGPKPRSRETAIVMLADSCESATRAMKDPTPDRVRDLIDTVVEGKINQGQLDDAPLTLREVAAVKDQFVKILSGVLHRRIEYPATKHLTDAPSEAGPDAAADPDAPASPSDRTAPEARPDGSTAARPDEPAAGSGA